MDLRTCNRCERTDRRIRSRQLCGPCDDLFLKFIRCNEKLDEFIDECDPQRLRDKIEDYRRNAPSEKVNLQSCITCSRAEKNMYENICTKCNEILYKLDRLENELWWAQRDFFRGAEKNKMYNICPDFM